MRMKLSDFFDLPTLPDYATNNAHMFYITVKSLDERTQLITYLKSFDIHAVFHYLALHKSPYYSQLETSKVSELPNALKFENQL